jgi:hypothetical protein
VIKGHKRKDQPSLLASFNTADRISHTICCFLFGTLSVPLLTAISCKQCWIHSPLLSLQPFSAKGQRKEEAPILAAAAAFAGDGKEGGKEKKGGNPEGEKEKAEGGGEGGDGQKAEGGREGAEGKDAGAAGEGGDGGGDEEGYPESLQNDNKNNMKLKPVVKLNLR